MFSVKLLTITYAILLIIVKKSYSSDHTFFVARPLKCGMTQPYILFELFDLTPHLVRKNWKSCALKVASHCK